MSTQIRSNPCIICAGQDFERIGSHDRHGAPLNTIACVQCGLIRHEELPTEDELRKFYASQYRQAYHGETRPSPRRIMRAWHNGRRIASQLATYLRPDDTSKSRPNVFEVGAGIGCNLKAFEALGCDVSGIEPHEGFCAYAQDAVRANVTSGTLQELSPAPSYDLVLLVHVIEHLRRPDVDVETISKMLHPGGLFYVECPNFSGPFARRSRLFHYAHIYNFLPETLRALVEQHGFRLLRRFSEPTSPNLQLLFVRDSVETKIPIDGFSQVQQVLESDNFFSYYSRPHYLQRSAARFARMAWEGVSAGNTVRHLEEKWAA